MAAGEAACYNVIEAPKGAAAYPGEALKRPVFRCAPSRRNIRKQRMETEKHIKPRINAGKRVEPVLKQVVLKPPRFFKGSPQPDPAALLLVLPEPPAVHYQAS
jgi:hypothetical protein